MGGHGVEGTVRYQEEAAGVGASSCGSADSTRQQHRKVTASLDLNKREKQKGLWDVIVERARVLP